ncbi:MAG TPA: helix-turn-helix domain-containing protein [Prosthecobacter sp.]|nr:helix-turn-helix domain-containing protein [Prosthecobacter sp.]
MAHLLTHQGADLGQTRPKGKSAEERETGSMESRGKSGGQVGMRFASQVWLIPGLMKSPTLHLLTKREAADLLRISTRTIDYWREAFALPCIERSGYVRFLMSDLESFVTAHRVASDQHLKESASTTTAQ